MTHLDTIAIWKREDGVSITYFDIRDKYKGESDEDFISRTVAFLKDFQFGEIEPVFVNKNTIPDSRESRDNWDLVNGVIVVNYEV
jgi:hypothetical protein